MTTFLIDMRKTGTLRIDADNVEIDSSGALVLSMRRRATPVAVIAGGSWDSVQAEPEKAAEPGDPTGA